MASIHASVRARLAVTPVWAWGVFLLLGAAGVLMWHEWANREQEHEEASWLDPEQPPPTLDISTQPAPWTRRKPYPSGHLMHWPCSKVGDC